jgi:hypothetical protein
MPQVAAVAIAAFQAAATAATTVGAAMGFSGIAATVAGAASLISSTQQAWSAVSSAIGGKPKVNASASQLQTKVGAVTPRSIIMGRTAVAGTLLTPTPLKSGKDDRFASNFYALSHAGPSGVVESVIWGDDTVTFDGSGNAIGKYNDNMWLFQKNGDWNQTAISYTGHPVLGSSTPTAWDSTKRARGCLTVALVVRYAAKVLGGNMQTPIFVVDANAVALTDPRTGLAATTQAQRRNPAVWAYSWRLGWFQNSKRVIGLGQASGELHAAGYAYAANVADANGWTVSGEATTADDRYAVESAILLAAASVPVERNGLQSVVTSALRSSVGTITSDDLRANPKWRYNTQQSSRPTAIQTRYRSESNRWQMVEGAEVTDASWLTQDAGREKRITVEYPYAAGGSAHVGHLAALDASNAREPLIFSLPCKQRARYAGFVGDAVTVSLPEIGLSSTKMVVLSRVVNADGTVDYELLVETDAKYAFAAGKTSAAPSFTLQPGFDIFSVPQPSAAEWTSVAAQITSGATSLPIVRVTGSAADYSFASGVVFKIRLNSGGSPWLVSEDAPPAATQHEFRGLTNATSYIVGIAYRGVTGVEGPVRELAAVTTGTLVAGEAGAGVGGKPILNELVETRANLFLYPRPPRTDTAITSYGWVQNGAALGSLATSTLGGNAYYSARASGSNATLEPYIDTPISSAVDTYTVSLRGSVNNGTFAPYMQTITSGGVALQTVGMTNVRDNLWVATVTANVGTPAAIRLVPRYIWPTSGTIQEVAFFDVKIERGPDYTPMGVQAILPGESGADVTSNAVPVLEGPASVSFDVDGAGALSPGSQVPRTLQFIRKRGATDVSSSTTWSIVSPVNVTLGAITNGGVNITAVAAGLSNFTVRSVRDGVTIDHIVTVQKNTLPPTSFSVALSTTSITATGTGTTLTTGNVTATPSGGTGPYSYAWAVITKDVQSLNPFMTSQSATSACRVTLGAGQAVEGTIQLTVTDTATGAIQIRTLTYNITNTA